MKTLILILTTAMVLPVFAGKDSASRYLFQTMEKSGAPVELFDGIRGFRPVQVHCTQNHHVNETLCQAEINGKSVSLKNPKAVIRALEQIDVHADPAMGTVHWYTGGLVCTHTIAEDAYRCATMENVD